MASKIKENLDDPIAEINIVPFVDIILVVLIIFMATAHTVSQQSLKVNLPKSTSGSDMPKSQLNIFIAANGSISLNGKIMEISELSSYSKKLVKQKPNTQAVISADKEVSHGAVVAIIDAIKSVGVRKFAITTNKK